jgi:hypothetical protein
VSQRGPTLLLTVETSYSGGGTTFFFPRPSPTGDPITSHTEATSLSLRQENPVPAKPQRQTHIPTQGGGDSPPQRQSPRATGTGRTFTDGLRRVHLRIVLHRCRTTTNVLNLRAVPVPSPSRCPTSRPGSAVNLGVRAPRLLYSFQKTISSLPVACASSAPRAQLTISKLSG